MTARIQRQRTPGWRLPANAVVVSRPTRWGNPFVLGVNGRIGARPDGSAWEAEDVVRWFREYAVARMAREPEWLAPLRGMDLACWCALDEPCHADVLLQLLGGAA